MAIDAALISLLSSVAGGRNNWVRGEGLSADQGPYLTLNWIGGPSDPTIGLRSGYVIARLQVDAYGKTYRAARAAIDAARDTLNGYRGTVADTNIKAVIAERPRSLPASDAGEASHLFRLSMDMMVHHDE